MQQQRRRNPLKVLQRIEEQRRTTNHLQAVQNLNSQWDRMDKKIHYFTDQKLECGIFSNNGGISQLHNEKVFKQGKNEEKILFQQLASIAIIAYSINTPTVLSFFKTDARRRSNAHPGNQKKVKRKKKQVQAIDREDQLKFGLVVLCCLDDEPSISQRFCSISIIDRGARRQLCFL